MKDYSAFMGEDEAHAIARIDGRSDPQRGYPPRSPTGRVLYLRFQIMAFDGVGEEGVPGRPERLEAMSLFVRSAPRPLRLCRGSIRGREPASTRAVGARCRVGGPVRKTRAGGGGCAS